MLRYVVGTFADGERYVICWRVAMNDRCCCSRSVGVALRWRVTAAVRLEGDSEMMFLGYLGCIAFTNHTAESRTHTTIEYEIKFRSSRARMRVLFPHTSSTIVRP